MDGKWMPKLNESLKNIEIGGQLHTMSWEEQISYLSISWIEKVTKPPSKKLQYYIDYINHFHRFAFDYRTQRGFTLVFTFNRNHL